MAKLFSEEVHLTNMATEVIDRLERPFRDLRISVTDRCNFRCRYCMPKEVFGRNFEFLPKNELLTFEEITLLVRIFEQMGLQKIRLTGGEPLLRRDLEVLVAMLQEASSVELTMTTNGSLLKRKAVMLKKAGLDRVSVSLDALDDETFMRMNDVDFSVERVLEGIKAAEVAGLTPIKINMVVKRGLNEHSIVPMAETFRELGHTLRFIEYMDVGSTNGWRMADVVPAAEIVQRIDAVYPLDAVEPAYRGEVAKRYRYRDGQGEIGLISSVTQPFCGDCTRLRMSADGSLYTCLFAARGFDLKSLLRGGASEAEIEEFVTGIWQNREDHYSELRTDETAKSLKVEMSYIGG
ncbi:MAG: GTP 3',8-cyclase MoaA [Anaerolineales bacterium]|jgi:cyclic pyranopterin phosphate synthase